jgi:hypothetical protein
MTWWTVILEGTTAIAFLWFINRGISMVRDLVLLIFCTTTYVVTPVEGFGWLLIAMGVAQCDSARRKTRLLYLAVFGLILFYREVPWTAWLSTFSHPS